MSALAVAAGLLVAAAPFAAPKGELLGGGRVGPRPTPGHADVAYTTLRVSKDARSIHVYGDWPARCGDGSVVTLDFDRVVALRRDGTFLAAGLLKEAALVGTFELEGRLRRATIGGQALTAAEGTGSADFAPRGGATACRTGQVDWQVRSRPRVGGPPTPKKGAAYYGSNDQTDPVVLRVSRDGRAIVQAGIEFALACRYARFRFASEVVPGAAIARDGSFSTVQRYTSRLAGSRYAGAVGRFTARLSGRFGASSVGGSLRVDVRLVGRTGALIDTCHSATRFAASL
jgi:hypothetical protein